MSTWSPAAIGLAADLGVLGGHACERHHRRGEAQQLLDGDGQDREVAAAGAPELVGMLEQREHAGGDEVAGGLGAGVLQQHEEHVDLHLVEPVAVDLGVQQHAS